MKVLGIIPARGGSKGVPRKNIKDLCGRPLLAYTIDGALNSKLLSRTILSTEDEEIAKVGRDLGIDVPFMRPAALAQDDSPTIDAVLHAVEQLEATGETYDAICLLQPTNPMRNGELIDQCIELFRSSEADSLVTVLPVPHEYNPSWVYRKSEAGTLTLATGDKQPIKRRQDLPEAFHREGSIYLTRVEVLKSRRDLYGDRTVGYELDPAASVNIDSPADWERAEEMITGSRQGTAAGV